MMAISSAPGRIEEGEEETGEERAADEHVPFAEPPGQGFGQRQGHDQRDAAHHVEQLDALLIGRRST
jgi:hypothetical protein